MVLAYFERGLETQQAIDLRAKTIRQLFGNVHMPDTLAAWLFANILVQVKSYVVGVYTKAYRVKRRGYAKLAMLMEQTRTETNQGAESRRFLAIDDGGLRALFGMADKHTTAGEP